jgi:hypothetical protein
MPRGTYLHDDGDPEQFQCAPGPGGWRYVGRRRDGAIDLTVDSRWRQIRVQLTRGDWLVRGGLAGPEVMWVRSGDPARGPGDPPTEHSAVATGFISDSPGLLIAVARTLALDEGERAEVRLVELAGPALAALTVVRRWELAETVVYETDLAPLRVERYEVTDLSTGEKDTVHLAGDVVVDAPGMELTGLEGPPSGTASG